MKCRHWGDDSVNQETPVIASTLPETTERYGRDSLTALSRYSSSEIKLTPWLWTSRFWNCEMITPWLKPHSLQCLLQQPRISVQAPLLSRKSDMGWEWAGGQWSSSWEQGSTLGYDGNVWEAAMHPTLRGHDPATALDCSFQAPTSFGMLSQPCRVAVRGERPREQDLQVTYTQTRQDDWLPLNVTGELKTGSWRF